MTLFDTSEWRKVLSEKHFRRAWLALLIGGTGTGALSVAIVWEIWKATESYVWVGGSVFAFMISGILTSWLAGYLTDRHSAKTICLVGMTGILVTSIMLYALWIAEALDTWAVMAVLFVRGVVVHIALISWRVFIPMLVEPNSLVQASRLDVGASNLSRMTGPLAAVPLVIGFGVTGMFWAGIVGAMLMIFAVTFAKPDHIQITNGSQNTNRDKGLFSIIKPCAMIASIGFLAAFTARSLWEISSGLAAEQYGSNIVGYSMFMAALGVGAVIAVVILGTIGDRLPYKHAATIFCSVMSVGLLLTAITKTSLVGYAGFFLLGAGHVIQAMSSNAESQRISTEHTRGKTLAVYIIAVSGGVSLGSIALGFSANHIGVAATHILAAIGLFILSLFLLCKNFNQKNLSDI